MSQLEGLKINNKYENEARNMNLMDRLLFSSAIEDNIFAENMTEIIFDEKYMIEESPQAEKEFRNLMTKKFVRLDSYMQTAIGKIIAAEVQNKNEHNMPKRTRSYGANIDVKQLKSGENDYNKLETVCIIVIASFDIGGNGKYRERFSMKGEAPEYTELNDGNERVFLNTRGWNADDVTDELIWMLRFFEETTREIAEASGSRRIIEMCERIELIKESDDFNWKLFCDREEKELLKKEYIAEGRAEGREEEKLNFVRNLKALGVAIDHIVKASGMSKAEVDAV